MRGKEAGKVWIQTWLLSLSIQSFIIHGLPTRETTFSLREMHWSRSAERNFRIFRTNQKCISSICNWICFQFFSAKSRQQWEWVFLPRISIPTTTKGGNWEHKKGFFQCTSGVAESSSFPMGNETRVWVRKKKKMVHSIIFPQQNVPALSRTKEASHALIWDKAGDDEALLHFPACSTLSQRCQEGRRPYCLCKRWTNRSRRTDRRKMRRLFFLDTVKHAFYFYFSWHHHSGKKKIWGSHSRDFVTSAP